MTAQAVVSPDPAHLAPVVDVATAAALLGIGRTAGYELIRQGRFPTPVLHLGKLIRVPTAPLLALIGWPSPTQGELNRS